MKKLLILLICLVFCCSAFCGCDKKDNEDASSTPSEENSSTDFEYSNPYENIEDFLSWPQFDEPIIFPEDEF